MHLWYLFCVWCSGWVSFVFLESTSALSVMFISLFFSACVVYVMNLYFLLICRREKHWTWTLFLFFGGLSYLMNALKAERTRTWTWPRGGGMTQTNEHLHSDFLRIEYTCILMIDCPIQGSIFLHTSANVTGDNGFRQKSQEQISS